MRAIFSYDFAKHNIRVIPKLLTNNQELDAKKVKVTRPSTGKIDTEQVKHTMAAYGQIEEMYEVRGNPNKRTFVVAFENAGDKIKMMTKSTVFIGSNHYKVENYIRGPQEISDIEAKRALTIRLANIRNSNTEFSVKVLLNQMRASYWYIPVSDHGIKLPIVIASLRTQSDIK